jgi:ethanolaminephosphotransferase
MDGKQARKIKASSPLGLLFDHGCDGLSVSLVIMTSITIMQVGNTTYAIFIFFWALIPFYAATWEEYYVGTLYLPLIHGASEGVVLLSSMYAVTAVVGGEFWKMTIIPGVPTPFILFLAMTLSCIYSTVPK